MPQVSIIMPVYNVEDYLSEALDAALDQTLYDIEVVCIDDGSSDLSGAILDDAALKDPRVRVIHQQNVGVSAARNVGVEAARGDFICFCDPDDRLESNACERIACELDTSGADILVFGAGVLGDDEPSVWLRDHLASRDATFEEFDPTILFTENVRPFIWRLALRSELFTQRGLRFEESLSLGEDQLFCFSAFPLARRVRMVPDELYRYRPARAGSLMAATKSGSLEQLQCHLDVVRFAFRRWDELGILEDNRDLMLTWLVEFVLYDALRLPDAECKLVFDEAAELLAERWDADAVVLDSRVAMPVRSILRASVRRSPLPAWRRKELMVRYYRWRDGLKALAVRFVRGGVEFQG